VKCIAVAEGPRRLPLRLIFYLVRAWSCFMGEVRVSPYDDRVVPVLAKVFLFHMSALTLSRGMIYAIWDLIKVPT
jgi:hypothetical protein